jgi:hypothetical protein
MVSLYTSFEISLSLSLFFGGTGVWIQGLILARQPHFFFFEMGSPKLFARSWLQNKIFLISAF